MQGQLEVGVLEEQMQQVGANRGRYNMAVTLMKKHMAMMKTAMGSGGGTR